MHSEVRGAAPQSGTLPPRPVVRERAERSQVTDLLTNARSGRYRAAARTIQSVRSRLENEFCGFTYHYASQVHLDVRFSKGRSLRGT